MLCVEVQTVLIGDVDDDGHTEFVIATDSLYNGVIQIYDGATHSLERQSQNIYSGASFTAMALGDVNSDGHTEVVVGQKRQDFKYPRGYISLFLMGPLLQKSGGV